MKTDQLQSKASNNETFQSWGLRIAPQRPLASCPKENPKPARIIFGGRPDRDEPRRSREAPSAAPKHIPSFSKIADLCRVQGVIARWLMPQESYKSNITKFGLFVRRAPGYYSCRFWIWLGTKNHSLVLSPHEGLIVGYRGTKVEKKWQRRICHPAPRGRGRSSVSRRGSDCRSL